ncbi:MAG TPA: AmmeMemoRadiSam system protein B, partial [Deferrisomatales bacterium]|nr:AmmeMemoRadiSam system protein B [Deferrisomatales bacterium]
MIRNPAVAGQFYSNDPVALRSYLTAALATDVPATPEVFGVVSPHAGYIYSGAVAGAVFGRVQVPGTVLLLGPNHTGVGTAASIVSSGAWATPLGTSEIDTGLAEALKAACPLLQEDTRAHAREHSLEVQLPFLQVCNPQVCIVPIAFMLRRFEEIEQVGRAIAAVLTTWPNPVLVVASSDMTHYESRAEAERKDRLAIDRVLAVDGAGLLATAREHGMSMCGVVPTAVMLVAAAAGGATGGELVRYATSGDTTGDYRQV